MAEIPHAALPGGRSTRAAPVTSGPAEFPFIFVEGVKYAVLVPGDMRQRAVPAVQVEFDRPHALGKTGGVLRKNFALQLYGAFGVMDFFAPL